jgi:hypothetical protein
MNRFDCGSGGTVAYFARPPEKLVVEGYRHWTSGLATGDGRHWEAAVDLYLDILGLQGSKSAIHALSAFVGALGRCAACPLKPFGSGSPHVCRDEVLILGLIAGIQNRDDEAAETCLRCLTCRDRCDEVALAAGSFALLLRGLDKLLLPIPAAVVNDIVSGAEAAVPGTTFH